MKNKDFTVKFTEAEGKTLINFLYKHCEENKELEPIIKTILNQRSEQLFPVPDTPWNNYLHKVNTKIVELDGDKIEQREYIFKCFQDMMSHDEFEKSAIVSWFNSQMQITGNGKFTHMFDYSALYPGKLDLSKLI